MTEENVLEQNKRSVRRAIEEGWNPANLAVIDELYAADFLFHQESGEAVRGIEAFKAWIGTIHGAFPDIRYQIEAMYAESDKVATRYTVRGTHTGDFRGLPATGRSFNLSGHLIHRVVDGQKTDGIDRAVGEHGIKSHESISLENSLGGLAATAGPST